MVERRALERYPTSSSVVDGPTTVLSLFDHTARNKFASELRGAHPRISAYLEQPFGKENLLQTFTSDAALRHVLLPLWKSGCLFGDGPSWASLRTAHYPARVLDSLLREYGSVPLTMTGPNSYNPNWETETDLNQERVQMATAAFLHFDGSVADLVRWIGGPHVAQHRDHHATLRSLERANVSPSVIANIRRIFLDGIPAVCNAHSTERNFQAYYRYGNHATVDYDTEKTYKAMVKDARKGFTLVMDDRVSLFMLHSHLTPQGVVDVDNPPRKPRPIFDSSFRPEPWCWAINDWTSKDNEPPLTFSTAEHGFMVWLYNLRVSYPTELIYIADDDISGAFRLMKYHPNLCAMHTSRQSGYCVVNTGGTFGDNTSPSNFDPIGLARRELGQYLWITATDAIQRVSQYLPALTLASPGDLDTTGSPALADRDSTNPGVINPDGTRMPPPYNMHVDDSLYADVGKYMVHTICVSILALFMVLGFPTNPLVPSPLSADKFEAHYNHKRKLVGRLFNSHTMTVGILPHKLEQLRLLLDHWESTARFDLMSLAHLLGTLENHTKYARWARCWYFSLQNATRRILFRRYHVVKRIHGDSTRGDRIRSTLPKHLEARIDSLIARDKATLLWKTKQTFPLDEAMRHSLAHLKHYVHDSDSPWEVPIGMIIPRDHHFWSRGDASFLGGGAYCPGLRFWFDIGWSPRTIKGATRTKPADQGYVHINSLEFIVVILQLAAVQVRLDECRDDPNLALELFPNGIPAIPVWLGETDNTVSCSWENRATARTSQGQGLVSVYAQLLRRRDIHTRCQHLAGKLNEVADDISRNNFSLSFASRSVKLYKVHPSLATLDYFLPSPELLQLLTSRLFSRLSPVPCALPETLGRFLPAGSTTSTSVTL